jgi:hypothetical protein
MAKDLRLIIASWHLGKGVANYFYRQSFPLFIFLSSCFTQFHIYHTKMDYAQKD